jgi:hypothetical protein
MSSKHGLKLPVKMISCEGDAFLTRTGYAQRKEKYFDL